VAEIAGSTQINVSTPHRLLQTLTRRGYAEQNPDTRSYARGPKLLELAARMPATATSSGRRCPASKNSATRSARPSTAPSTATATTLKICTTAGHQAVSVGFRAGDYEPAHCAATGKVQLAFLPEQGLERLVEHGPWSAARRRASSARLPW